MIKFLASLCSCFCCSQTLLAWNAEGHMILAQIAYNHLNSTVKAKCDALLAVPLAYGSDSTSNFVTAACWADDYKSKLNTGTWHYIDLPFSLDGTSTNGFVPASFDIVQAINLAISTLQSSSASQSNRAVSLRYLLHLVGDIQQPLHCSDAFFASQPNGDGGGNGFYVIQRQHGAIASAV
jgi:S1/P1 Nuclease